LTLPEKDFKKSEDSIVDICQGSHFTLVVTKSGQLFGTGKLFMQTIGVNQEQPGKFTKIKIADDIKV
jgi:alpha-tubulin suppressor-like RCC1 family protein